MQRQLLGRKLQQTQKRAKNSLEKKRQPLHQNEVHVHKGDRERGGDQTLDKFIRDLHPDPGVHIHAPENPGEDVPDVRHVDQARTLSTTSASRTT